MHIAQIAPLWESVPARAYGAVETLVADLATKLIELGLQVTVFAAGDSKVAGTLVPGSLRALNASPEVAEPEVYRIMQLQEARDRAAEFDVFHSHLHSNSGTLALPMLAGLETPVLHTVHCFYNEDNTPLFRRFAGENFIAISHDQRRRLPELNYRATVHHGVDVARFPFVEQAAAPAYLAYLGRIRPEKGVHLAIEAAKAAGIPLKLAGRVAPRDRGYFEERIVPHVDGRRVVFLGELDFDGKTKLLAHARALLMPSLIPEPFGLVTIEAMACGTPVLAVPSGATPELVVNGVTGLFAMDTDGLAQAALRVGDISRRHCRDHVLRGFHSGRMARDYAAVYRQLADA